MAGKHMNGNTAVGTNDNNNTNNKKEAMDGGSGQQDMVDTFVGLLAEYDSSLTVPAWMDLEEKRVTILR